MRPSFYRYFHKVESLTKFYEGAKFTKGVTISFSLDLLGCQISYNGFPLSKTNIEKHAEFMAKQTSAKITYITKVDPLSRPKYSKNK